MGRISRYFKQQSLTTIDATYLVIAWSQPVQIVETTAAAIDVDIGTLGQGELEQVQVWCLVVGCSNRNVRDILVHSCKLVWWEIVKEYLLGCWVTEGVVFDVEICDDNTKDVF